ncbi:MAG TPA: hypothetical protein VLA55_02565 [Ornithinibacter sp.]|nr:hypothetical protein [Ornithinibacter sp.]
MPALTAWCYGTPLGATAGSVRLRRMEQARALDVIDAIVVSWAPGAHRPRVTWSWSWDEVGQREPSVLVALLRTSFAAASTHASLPAHLTHQFAAAGLDPDFLQAVIARLSQRTSALLVLSGEADLSVVVPAVRQRIVSGDVALLQSELPADGPERLRAALGLEAPRSD